MVLFITVATRLARGMAVTWVRHWSYLGFSPRSSRPPNEVILWYFLHLPQSKQQYTRTVLMAICMHKWGLKKKCSKTGRIRPWMFEEPNLSWAAVDALTYLYTKDVAHETWKNQTASTHFPLQEMIGSSSIYSTRISHFPLENREKSRYLEDLVSQVTSPLRWVTGQCCMTSSVLSARPRKIQEATIHNQYHPRHIHYRVTGGP